MVRRMKSICRTVFSNNAIGRRQKPNRCWNPLCLLLPIIITFAAINLAGCGDEDKSPTDGNKPTPPATLPKVSRDMQGLWNYETIGRDCVTGVVNPDFSDSGIDTLCEGDPMYEAEDDDFFPGCDVTIINSSAFRIECELTETVMDCTIHYSMVLEFSYTNTTVTAVGTQSITYSGAGCGDEENECYNVSTTATRVGAAPGGACPGTAAARSMAGGLMGRLLKNR